MKHATKPILSKMAYFHGRQCLKKLFLYGNQVSLNITPDETPDNDARLMLMGQKVGLLARELFPYGIDCSAPTLEEQLHKTKQLMSDKHHVLYEAAIEAIEASCNIDILVHEGNKEYSIYEVKSSARWNDDYLVDAQFQYTICRSAGMWINNIYIVHINKEYRRNKTLDVSLLFEKVDVTSEMRFPSSMIERIAAFREILVSSSAPKIPIGPHCSKPHDCCFKSYCHAEISLPSYSVLNLTNARNIKWELLKDNIKQIADIPPNMRKLSVSQRIQVMCEKSQEMHIELGPLQNFLNTIKYPVYFLDFETISSAIPFYNNTSPYQQICTQYSLHILNENNDLLHAEYLTPTTPHDITDRREELLQHLIKDIGSHGTICIYSSFEIVRLHDLKKDFPAYAAAIDSIIKRCRDLAKPFRDKFVYHPAMQGKYSIKKVLPALVPELSYDGLAVRDGVAAANVFLDLLQGEYVGDVQQARKDLLEYCKLDTYAMVKLYEKLQEYVKR